MVSALPALKTVTGRADHPALGRFVIKASRPARRDRPLRMHTPQGTAACLSWVASGLCTRTRRFACRRSSTSLEGTLPRINDPSTASRASTSSAGSWCRWPLANSGPYRASKGVCARGLRRPDFASMLALSLTPSRPRGNQVQVYAESPGDLGRIADGPPPIPPTLRDGTARSRDVKAAPAPASPPGGEGRWSSNGRPRGRESHDSLLSEDRIWSSSVSAARLQLRHGPEMLLTVALI